MLSTSLLLSVGSSYAAWQQSAESLKCSKIKTTQIHTSPDSSFSEAKKKQGWGGKKDRKKRDRLFAEYFCMRIFCRRLIGKGVSMPTRAENRRLNLEKHPPPSRRFGCTDDVAQWLAHGAGWQDMGLLYHKSPCLRGWRSYLTCPQH